MSQPTYHVLSTNLCREKCTWKKEYFEVTAEQRTSISEYEDKVIYRSVSKLHRMPPVGAVPCPLEQWAAVLARCEAEEAKVKAAADLAKAEAKAKYQRAGMMRNQHAAREAGAAEDAPAVVVPLAGLLDVFTVLDLEFQGDELLEVAAIRYEHWQPVREYVSFVQFRGDINYHVGKLTGITRGDVWNAPDEKTVLRKFRELAGDSVLVCHNITADRTKLELARERQGAATPLTNEWLCTLALSRLRHPKLPSHKLGDLCRAFGIKADGAHRALRDVEMCGALLRRLHEQQPVTELITSTSAKKKAKQPTLFAA